MSEAGTQGTGSPPMEVAAGGLVWSGEKKNRRLAVVHRKKRRDWTLPKGRPILQDATMEATALREAREETGHDVSPGRLAGSYCYFKADRPKVVLMWHMERGTRARPDPVDKAEIDNVRWLSPDQALHTLSHKTEREFVSRHREENGRPAAMKVPTKDPKINRLRAAICGCRERLRAATSQLDADAAAWWADSAGCALETAEAAMNRGDLDGGWGALHDAKRFLVFGMNDAELLARASTLEAETRMKLKGWRLKATNKLFALITPAKWLKESCSPKDATASENATTPEGATSPKDATSLKDEHRTLVRHVVVESLSILNAHSDNLYHRLGLVGLQLNYLVGWCGFLIGVVLLGAYLFVEPGSTFDWGHLTAVALAGALGGVVSAMFQLSRVGEAKIPDALMHGLITSGRPLVGAASALFIYAVMHSRLISLIDASEVSLKAGLVLGFVAGFSEQFVLGTVAKVTGRDRGGSSAGGGPGGDGSEGMESIDAFDNAPGTSEKKKTRDAAPQVSARQKAQKKTNEAKAASSAEGATSEPTQTEKVETKTPRIEPKPSETEKPDGDPQETDSTTAAPPERK